MTYTQNFFSVDQGPFILFWLWSLKNVKPLYPQDPQDGKEEKNRKKGSIILLSFCLPFRYCV